MARTLKQQIRNVIRQHYGKELDVYAQMAGDRKGLMNAFVDSLARDIKIGSVPPVDCKCQLNNFDGQPSPIDIELGKRIRTLRIQCLISVQELASRMGVHPDYLSELEQGKLTPHRNTRDVVLRALGVPHFRTYLLRDLDEEGETEAWIRYTISRHFGRSLWSFRPEVSYEESITPFVRALLDLDKGRCVPAAPRPELPSLFSAHTLKEDYGGFVENTSRQTSQELLVVA
ncbi:MAG TPA: helix-turn-helix transcriptional regulator [Candidatus Saccharimonadales bacterium]|nr:helix-turn-helix transcriptional regulator [Candidatus Saccharimonadales bacterium]